MPDSTGANAVPTQPTMLHAKIHNPWRRDWRTMPRSRENPGNVRRCLGSASTTSSGEVVAGTSADVDEEGKATACIAHLSASSAHHIGVDT